MRKVARLSRIGIATFAAGAPVAGAVALSQPAAAAVEQGPPGLSATANNTDIYMWTNPGAPNGEWSWCSQAKNNSSVSPLTGHLEFFLNGSFYQNSPEFSIRTGSYSPTTCYDILYPGFYDLGVTFWKDAGGNHSAMVHVQDY